MLCQRALDQVSCTHFPPPVQSTVEVPEFIRTTVLLVCLGVVLRMVFSFVWFYYLFM